LDLHLIISAEPDLDLIMLAWTSSSFPVQFRDCKLLYWDVCFGGVSQICRGCTLRLLKCWI